ncbi:amidohydrolase [Lujinxingia vulgaris]|uniref:Amidohydrolase n=1 Tax=Lujinxingia vulgaris TaxID=2600176 RepID=A0A5C6XDN1_9DELT|nr:M20 family metallopeptidase [Lujinxingia vulgaris]TXD36212.1 amidohydrolase [Lujinxingia vulgaris]
MMSQDLLTLDDELVAWRRHLHAHPELSFEEHQTAAFIEDQLAALGLKSARVAETGVVALIEGELPGPTRAFRADIDALPIQELRQSDYCSTRAGVMHACGHDVHTTVGLGVARELVARRSELKGRVKMIFQPAEEASPTGEPIGAERMAVEGVLEAPQVEAILALHCMPTLEVGKIGYTGGPVWAASELVEVVIEGKKSHGAYPHEGIDAVAVAAQVIVALQQVVSRITDAREAVVLSIGKLEAGNSYNIIAERAELTGILRGLSAPAMERARDAARQIVEGVSAALGARASIRFVPGARLTANDAALEARVVRLVEERVGEGVMVKHLPQLGAEDFAAFSTRVPAAYFFLGVKDPGSDEVHPLHTPRFDVDERCLTLGVRAITEALLGLG